MRIDYLIRAIDKQDDDSKECGMDEPSGTQGGHTGFLLGEPNLSWRFGTGFTLGTYLIRTKLQKPGRDWTTPNRRHKALGRTALKRGTLVVRSF